MIDDWLLITDYWLLIIDCLQTENTMGNGGQQGDFVVEQQLPALASASCPQGFAIRAEGLCGFDFVFLRHDSA